MTRLTTRSIATAEHIRDRKPFTTSGALYGETRNPDSSYLYSGNLSGFDAEALRCDLMGRVGIDYVVVSYSTPIAWHRTDDTWHIVAQSFSITTSKHQGNLYLCRTRGLRRPEIIWCGMKGGVNQGYDVWLGDEKRVGHGETKHYAEYIARYVNLNGLPPALP